MEPIAAISIAKAIADASGISGWLSEKIGETFGQGAANKITEVAKAVTGETDPEKALEKIIQQERLKREFKLQLMDRENELILAHLHDIQDARQMYISKSHMADKIADRVIKTNHWLVASLLIANGVVLVLVTDKVVAVALGNLIGGCISHLWQERQQVMQFCFGSSLGSKMKSLVKA